MKNLIVIIVALFTLQGCLSCFPTFNARAASENLVGLEKMGLPDSPKTAATTPITNHQAYGQMSLSFEANQGQTDSRVKYFARGNQYTLFLTKKEAVLTLINRQPAEKGNPSQAVALRMKLAGANPEPEIEGLEMLAQKTNYFTGNDPKAWRTNVPSFARVRYNDVYPGIDLIYYGNQRQLEYDFVVDPGADPRKIQLSFEGAQKARLDAGGDLVLTTAVGEVRHHKPAVYQIVEGIRREIPARYVMKAGRQIGFEVANYDSRQPLIIDPVLVYSTYLGGSAFDLATNIAVDATGNAYVTGATASINFPTTSGAYQTTAASFSQAFVSKLNASGSALVYSTYIGEGEGFAIAVDGSGNAFLAGTAYAASFPTTTGAFDTTYNGNNDGFVTKLNPTGSALIYSTFLGGDKVDTINDLAIDSDGNAYVTGKTISTGFPVTAGAFQPAFHSGLPLPCASGDAFVTKLNAAGTALVYSTFLGAGNDEEGKGISVDAASNAYIAGTTQSDNFPTTVGAFQVSLTGVDCPSSCTSGCSDGFVTKLNATGTDAVYSTYLGGTLPDAVNDIAIDSSGSAFVTGSTYSTDFPRLNPIQAALTSLSRSAFVTKLNPAGSNLLYSTYLGGGYDDEGLGIVVDSSGNSYVTGRAGSVNFPTVNAVQPAMVGGQDAFVTKLNAAGSAMIYSTFLGGSRTENLIYGGIAVDGTGNAYVAGYSGSPDFPSTAGAFQTTAPTGDDGGPTPNNAFVVKLSESNECMQLAKPGEAFPAGGGADQINLTASGACPWKSLSNVSWITIPPGNMGTGSGVVPYTVAANPSLLHRRGTITVGGKAFIVNQAGGGPDTIGSYRSSNQTFYLRTSNSAGLADYYITYGLPGDIPLAGDWDGDGYTSIGIYRPSDQTFYLRNSTTAGNADLVIPYGAPGDLPLVGDWDGNGTTNIGVYRPSNATFYLRAANNPGPASSVIPYGASGDIPVVGDWDGDDTWTIGIYRPSESAFYLRNTNSIGAHDTLVHYGAANLDVPVVGDWDGNGTVTVGVYRSTTATFYLRNANTDGFADLYIPYGASSDKPLAGAWNGLR